MENKERSDIIRECARAAAACWNHYADQPLEDVDVLDMDVHLDSILPKKVTTWNWRTAAMGHNRRLAKEDQGEDV